MGTRAFPSQGSLANMELLAAQGSMGPNGWINNSVYVNPFEPGRDGRRRQLFRESPQSPRRRKRLSTRSRSTDLAEFEATSQETCLREGRGPKHKRPRGYQVNNPMTCHAMTYFWLIRQNSGQNSFDKLPILFSPPENVLQNTLTSSVKLPCDALPGSLVGRGGGDILGGGQRQQGTTTCRSALDQQRQPGRRQRQHVSEDRCCLQPRLLNPWRQTR